MTSMHRLVRFLCASLAVLYIGTVHQHLAEAHSLARGNKTVRKAFNVSDCKSVQGFTDDLRREIRSKASEVNKIIDLVLNGDEKHSTYDELALVCDTYGPRLSGSKALGDAFAHMHKKMQDSKLDVSKEKAMIPHWEVGEQWAEIVSPRRHKMSILALGTSVGTPNNASIKAEVALVHSFQELDDLGKAGKLSGKIVVYNYQFTSYGESVKFRTEGALRAAKYGAVAALVRSVTPFSIYSPHAGAGSRSIPTAAITVEDAELIQRMINRNQSVDIKLKIDAKNFDDVESYNLIGEIKGSSKPEEVVVVSGHMDSWYNTDGAMDDGGGMIISYKAVDLLRKLNLRAKRTVRAILWTSEEFGLIGAQQYFKNHKHELDKFKLVMESDLGTFKPLGLSFVNMSPLGQCVVSEVLALTEKIGTTKLDTSYEGSDIEVFTDVGVPGLSLLNANDKYFYYHHTSGDSMTIEDPDFLDKSTILWAAASYVLADLDVELK